MLHHAKGVGVGAVKLTGQEAALERNCKAMVRVEADGPHPPLFERDLVLHLWGQRRGEMALAKGSRY